MYDTTDADANQTDSTDANNYDDTQYADFDAPTVADRAASELAERPTGCGRISQWAADRFPEYYERQTVYSVAEFVDAIPEGYENHEKVFAHHAKEHVDDDCHLEVSDDGSYVEPDYTFGLAVARNLVSRDEWGALQEMLENASGTGYGPAEMARAEDLPTDPHDTEAVETIADGAVEWYTEMIKGSDDVGPETAEPDHSFSMAVTHHLARHDEWGAIQYAAENAVSAYGYGPVEAADVVDVEPDPDNFDAIKDVANWLTESYAALLADGYQGYGPDAADDEGDADGEGDETAVEKPTEAVDNHHRLNEGKSFGGHRVYAELDRLQQAGVEVQSHRIVETADDNHPDYLEIQYGGVSADEIENHRYRHIDSTTYYGVASRPLSELALTEEATEVSD